MDNDDEQLKLDQFPLELFDNSNVVENTLRKYFKFMNNIETFKHIAYRNETCKIVSDAMRKKLGKSGDYEVDEILLCRKYVKTKKCKIPVNYEFKIAKIEDDIFTLVNELRHEAFELPLDIINKHSIHNYCKTCHSAQGTTINSKCKECHDTNIDNSNCKACRLINTITMFDWNFFFVNRKWIWTAVTRVTSLDNVYFYDGKSSHYNEAVLDNYLNNKVKQYAKQDREANRKWSSNDITKDWLKPPFGDGCSGCGE